MLLAKKKIKFFHQLESVDCGPACLGMICSYHGLDGELRDLKAMCSVTRMGISVQDIVSGGNQIGFETAAIKVSLDELEEIPLPAILFWKQDHFVVLTKIKNKKGKRTYYISDPGYGRISIEEEIFAKEWIGNNNKGVAIVFQIEDENQLTIVKKDSYSVKKRAYLSILFTYIKKQKTKYILAILLLFFGLVTNWAMPIVFQRILDDGILKKSLDVVWILLAVQLTLFLSNFIATFISEWALTKINFHLSIVLKEQFLNKLMRLPISYFDTRLNTDTLERLGDQEKIKNFVTWKGLNLVLHTFNILVFSVMLYFLNAYVFGIYLLLSIISIIWIAFFLRLRAIVEYSLFLRQSENSNMLYEFIMNMPEIKTNNAQSTIIQNISDIQQKLNKLELRSLFLNMYQLIGVNVLSKLKEITAIALCAYLIIEDQMSIGVLLGITYILGQLNGPIQNLMIFIKDAQDAKISNKRLLDVYLEEDEDSGVLLTVPKKIVSLSVKNISFKYAGSFNPFVLHDVSFEIPIKKVTAIVGQSGSGKTTLLKLLLRHHHVTSGGIFINDFDLNDFNSESWRSKCGVVSQEGYIYSGTIAHNISFSDPKPDVKRIIEAAKMACVEDFIDELPMGYTTKIGNVGIQLSGGQKQRILIARAIYRNPEFIFFDEATSSLDANNEKMIMANLDRFFIGKTVFIVAHRLSTVKNADQILVLEKGRIGEIGDHTSLVERKGLYYELVKNQLELGN